MENPGDTGEFSPTHPSPEVEKMAKEPLETEKIVQPMIYPSGMKVTIIMSSLMLAMFLVALVCCYLLPFFLTVLKNMFFAGPDDHSYRYSS